MVPVVVLVRRTLVAAGLVGCVVGGMIVGATPGGPTSVGEEATPTPVVDAVVSPVDAPPALAPATGHASRGVGPASPDGGATTAPTGPDLAACPADAAAPDERRAAVDAVDATDECNVASRWDRRLTEGARGADEAAVLGYETFVYDLSMSHRDAMGPATFVPEVTPTDERADDRALKCDQLEAALKVWPRAAVRIVSREPRLTLRITAPSAARSTIEAALDRIATIDGPVATVLVEELDSAATAEGWVRALMFDAPKPHAVSATGGRARITCGGLDLEVGQECFLYTPVFDLVRDGLDVRAVWDREDDSDVVRVNLGIGRSFDQSGAGGGVPDVEVAQDAPFAPPELVAPLTRPTLTRVWATTVVPAVAGAVVEAECGTRRYRVTVLRVDDSAPVRRGWVRADVALAAGGYVPPDAETLDFVVDRPGAAGGPVAGRVDLVGRTPVDASLALSSVRDADVGDASDATARELAALARLLTTPFTVRAAACDADPERPERTFDLSVTVAGDDLTWDPIDVPRPWGTDALRRNEPIVIRSLRRPSVTSVVLPLRVRIGPGGEVRRALTIDRGHGPEQWVLTVLRRAPHDR